MLSGRLGHDGQNANRSPSIQELKFPCARGNAIVNTVPFIAGLFLMALGSKSDTFTYQLMFQYKRTERNILNILTHIEMSKNLKVEPKRSNENFVIMMIAVGLKDFVSLQHRVTNNGHAILEIRIRVLLFIFIATETS